MAEEMKEKYRIFNESYDDSYRYDEGIKSKSLNQLYDEFDKLKVDEKQRKKTLDRKDSDLESGEFKKAALKNDDDDEDDESLNRKWNILPNDGKRNSTPSKRSRFLSLSI